MWSIKVYLILLESIIIVVVVAVVVLLLMLLLWLYLLLLITLYLGVVNKLHINFQVKLNYSRGCVVLRLSWGFDNLKNSVSLLYFLPLGLM